MSMSVIKYTSKGNFKKANSRLERMKEVVNFGILDKYGKIGVQRLREATPKFSGLAAGSWYYTIDRSESGLSLSFYNSDIENGCSVVLLVQYGHATKNGGYIQGIDFINPALQPVFEALLDEIRREVKR